MSYRAFTSGIEWTSLVRVKTEARPTEITDDILVTRTLAGDTGAFRILVERYQQRVHAVALGVLGNFQDAEDVTQDAFLKAYRNLASFRGQSSFYTWVYRITFNLAIDERRKRYRHVETSVGETAVLDVVTEPRDRGGPPLLSESPKPDEEAERGELREQIKRAIAGLSPEHRAVIMLREIEGLSYAEISNVVGCSKGTVMSRLHHARRRLKRALQGAGVSEEEEDSGEVGKPEGLTQTSKP